MPWRRALLRGAAVLLTGRQRSTRPALRPRAALLSRRPQGIQIALSVRKQAAQLAMRTRVILQRYSKWEPRHPLRARAALLSSGWRACRPAPHARAALLRNRP